MVIKRVVILNLFQDPYEENGFRNEFRMTLITNNMKKILAISPHPDDIEFSIGGLLHKEAQSGNTIKILMCSRGEAGTNGTPVEREDESRKAAQIIGAEIEFVDMGGDCQIEDSRENAFVVAREIRRFQPDILLAPQLTPNQHPDHSRVARMAVDAARYARYGGLSTLKGLDVHKVTNIFFYASSVNDQQNPDVVVDVSGHIEQWREVMNCHASQLKTKNYLDLIESRARFLGVAIGADYAVGLWKNDPLQLESLTDISRSGRGF